MNTPHTQPRVLLSELSVEIYGAIELENQTVSEVRAIAEYIVGKSKIFIEGLAELQAKTKPGEIEVRIR